MIPKKTLKVWITVPSEKKCRALKLFPSTHSFVASCKCCQQRPRSIEVIVVYLQCSLPFFVLVNLLARTVFENIFFSFFLHKFNAIYRQKEEEEEETSAQSAQSLGVHIDEALTWATHTKETSKKLTSAIGACDTVPPSTLQTMYNSFIQPYFDYCSNVWTQNELWSFKNYKTARLGWQLLPDWLYRSGPLPQELVWYRLLCSVREDGDFYFWAFWAWSPTRKLQTS